MKDNGNVYIYRQDMAVINSDIINNLNIDFYSLGVYLRLKYFIEHNIAQTRLYEIGNEVNVNKALEKLVKNGYLTEEFNDKNN